MATLRGLRSPHTTWLHRVLTILAGVLVIKVTLSVLTNYHAYFASDFTSDFLHGREGHFHGVYRVAFFAHILSGPTSLILGLFLVSHAVRTRFPTWHRRLGRVQVGLVLLLVTPSGLVMARHAAAGPVAVVALGSLAIATAGCAAMGWRAAVMRRFADHRRWMWRCYLLLASAVVLRLIGGLVMVSGIFAPWVDPLASWLCWVGPLAVFEVRERAFSPRRRFTNP